MQTIPRSAYPKLLKQLAPNLEGAWKEAIGRIAADFASRVPNGKTAEIFADYAIEPGKLIRPTLFLYAATGWGAAEPAGWLLDLAISFELLHLFLLIQDDIMDDSQMRRGKPALHKLFEAEHREQKLLGSGAAYGLNLAILISDLCENYAEKVWTRAQVEGFLTADVREYFDDLKEEVYWGQYLDLALPGSVERPEAAAVIEMMKAKTARYSFYYPLLIGAVTHDPGGEYSWIDDFAVNLGTAFQAVDDLLGTFGDPGRTGKSRDDDIRQRKHNLLVSLAMERGNAAEQRVLADHYHYVKNVPADRIRKVFETSKAREMVADFAQSHYGQSLDALVRSPLSERQRQPLADLAEFILARAN